MANKIGSQSISVYPCGNRDMSIDFNSRMNTEYNLVSIVNRLVDMKSFVISKVEDGRFCFNVGGYLFDVKWEDLIGMLNVDDKYLYAGICVGQIALQKGGETSYEKFQELLPLNLGAGDWDVTNMDTSTGDKQHFNGIVFIQWDELIDPGADGSSWVSTNNGSGIFANITSAVSANTYQYFVLPLLHRTNSTTYEVPQESKVKMTTSQNGLRRSVTIDDGVLE